VANTEPAQPKKRRLKAPTQTVRQQAEKAQATAAKPERRRIKAAAGKAKKPFQKPASFLKRVFDRQPFRFIGKIGHWIGLVLVPRFVRNAFKEVRLVTWPNFKQTRDLTFAVLMFAVVFGTAVALLDWGLDKLFKSLILK
jgi:preprotein translocase SecE subunit